LLIPNNKYRKTL